MTCILAAVALVALVGVGAAAPGNASQPAPHTNATRWSDDADACLTADGYREQYGRDPQPAELLATCTDFTYETPPNVTAANDRLRQSMTPGDETTSLGPSSAPVGSDGQLRDVRVSLLTVSPSTLVHENATTTRFVRPTGTVHGYVDYRVDTTPVTTANTTVTWRLQSHRVEAVSFATDRGIVATDSNTQQPTFTYRQLPTGRTQFRLTATVTAAFERTATVTANGTREATTELVTANVTVTQTQAVVVTRPSADTAVLANHDGTRRVIVSNLTPWSRYSLAGTPDHAVQNVWRFYTAAEPAWQTLDKTTATTTAVVHPTARPLVVHAVPTRPRPEPDRPWGPLQIEERTGAQHARPQFDDSNLTTTPTAYQHVDRLRLRQPAASSVTLHGLVAGPPTTRSLPATPQRARNATLTLTTVSRSLTDATLRVTLTDDTTGAPLSTGAPGTNHTGGVVTVAGTPVSLNETGQATVVVSEPGSYRATYRPATWRPGQPAYVATEATATWHPLTTTHGLTDAFWELLKLLLAVGAVVYALHQLGRLSTPNP
ncbi:hypothetical protein NKF06_06685 [Haloferax sp. AB510]|uniref:hypothetical protein n=1 Tax=Haloferax sp. AB510 TaxID=2934172 RepID=UPI00209BD218|nr:hypothetical protein [Haloferax sp. AB510]MCO8266278.1 hypothetical protein [Haloferax sp. AB510]